MLAAWFVWLQAGINTEYKPARPVIKASFVTLEGVVK